jgi:hypothetical protein
LSRKILLLKFWNHRRDALIQDSGRLHPSNLNALTYVRGIVAALYLAVYAVYLHPLAIGVTSVARADTIRAVEVVSSDGAAASGCESGAWRQHAYAQRCEKNQARHSGSDNNFHA